MRTQFIAEYDAENLDDAYDAAPWAAEIIKVDGGWMAFESADDLATWENQV